MVSPAILSDSDLFHSMNEDRVDDLITRSVIEGKILDKDEKLIKAYISYRSISRNIGIKRQYKIAYHLVSIRRYIGPFLDNSILDIYTGINSIKSGKTKTGDLYKLHTICDSILILKSFYKWLIDEELVILPIKKIDQIQVPSRKGASSKKSDDLLTQDEVQKIIDSAQNVRDRCLLAMLYEGGFRIGEMGTLKWNQIKVDQYGAAINLNFKTNVDRYVRLVIYKDEITMWKANYPGIPEGENNVYITRRKEPMSYNGMVKRLKIIVKDAGINKKVTPHLFRHSRITHLIQEGVSESIIKMMMWGSVNSDMFSVYAHLSGKDIDDEMLDHYGITDRKTVEKIEPLVCPSCKSITSPSMRYCPTCGINLSNSAIQSEQELSNFLNKNRDLLIEFLSKNQN